MSPTWSRVIPPVCRVADDDIEIGRTDADGVEQVLLGDARRLLDGVGAAEAPAGHRGAAPRRRRPRGAPRRGRRRRSRARVRRPPRGPPPSASGTAASSRRSSSVRLRRSGSGRPQLAVDEPGARSRGSTDSGRRRGGDQREARGRDRRLQRVEHEGRQRRRGGGGEQGVDVGDQEHAGASGPAAARAAPMTSCTRCGGRAGLQRGGAGRRQLDAARADGGGRAARQCQLADALRTDDEHAEPGRATEAGEQLGAVEGQLEPLDEAAGGGGVADQVLDGRARGSRGGAGGVRPPAPRTWRAHRSASLHARRSRATLLPDAPRPLLGHRRTPPGRLPDREAAPVHAPSPSHPTTVRGSTATAPAGSTSATVSSSVVQPRPARPPPAAGRRRPRPARARRRGSSETASPPVTTLPSSASRTVSGVSAARASRDPVSSTRRAARPRRGDDHRRAVGQPGVGEGDVVQVACPVRPARRGRRARW